jgi:hypothetical protein
MRLHQIKKLLNSKGNNCCKNTVKTNNKKTPAKTQPEEWDKIFARYSF